MSKSENSFSVLQQELTGQPETVIVSLQNIFNPQEYAATQVTIVLPTGYNPDALLDFVKSLVISAAPKQLVENTGAGKFTLEKQELLMFDPS